MGRTPKIAQPELAAIFAGTPCAPCKPDDSTVNQSIAELIRKTDLCEFIRRVIWTNLPTETPAADIERMIYYKDSIIFWYNGYAERFMATPFVGCGGLDYKGRPKKARPLAFRGGLVGSDADRDTPIISGLELDLVYDVVDPEDLTEEMLSNSAVIIRDHTPGISEKSVPRAYMIEDLIRIEAACIPYMRTNLLNSVGITGIHVQSDDEQPNVTATSHAVKRAALNGEAYVGMTLPLASEPIGTNAVSRSEEFLVAMQSLDNFRLQTAGVVSGGLFQKKAHMLAEEALAASGASTLVLDDSILSRQRSCDVINGIWGLGADCVASESAVGADTNGDMTIGATDDPGASEGGEEAQV